MGAAKSRLLRWTAFACVTAAAILCWINHPWDDVAGQATALYAGDEVNLSVRFEIWSRAIYGIQDFPFTGMGMNAFRKVVHVQYPLFTVSPDLDIAHAHNAVLQAALDLGIPGMIACLGIWSTAGLMLVRVYRHSKNPLRRRVALGIGAGLVAHFLFGMGDAIPLGAKVGVFWWVALAIAAALFQLETADKPMRPLARAWEVSLLWMLVSLVAISFVGDHPYRALTIAAGGGVLLGFLSVPARVADETQSPYLIGKTG